MTGLTKKIGFGTAAALTASLCMAAPSFASGSYGEVDNVQVGTHHHRHYPHSARYERGQSYGGRRGVYQRAESYGRYGAGGDQAYRYDTRQGAYADDGYGDAGERGVLTGRSAYVSPGAGDGGLAGTGLFGGDGVAGTGVLNGQGALGLGVLGF